MATPVSEPATLGLLAIGMIGLRLAARRRRSH
ncbi:MAG: PEP-CTERM sorting domain-containing protein [Geminicoccaceae bacterium]